MGVGRRGVGGGGDESYQGIITGCGCPGASFRNAQINPLCSGLLLIFCLLSNIDFLPTINNQFETVLYSVRGRSSGVNALLVHFYKRPFCNVIIVCVIR